MVKWISRALAEEDNEEDVEEEETEDGEVDANENLIQRDAEQSERLEHQEATDSEEEDDYDGEVDQSRLGLSSRRRGRHRRRRSYHRRRRTHRRRRRSSPPGYGSFVQNIVRTSAGRGKMAGLQGTVSMDKVELHRLDSDIDAEHEDEDVEE